MRSCSDFWPLSNLISKLYTVTASMSMSATATFHYYLWHLYPTPSTGRTPCTVSFWLLKITSLTQSNFLHHVVQSRHRARWIRSTYAVSYTVAYHFLMIFNTTALENNFVFNDTFLYILQYLHFSKRKQTLSPGWYLRGKCTSFWKRPLNGTMH